MLNDQRNQSRARRRLRVGTVLTVLATSAAGALVLAAPASAHVTVNPREATQGGFAKLAFRVPNESDTAGTTMLQVTMPTDTPLAFVSVRPVAGWQVEVVTAELPEPVETDDFTLTEAVSTITWTADPGTRIEPGQFQEFEVSAGPMPEVETLAFPADQTYDDGTVVSWNEPVVEGAEEPEHPAPTLTLMAAAGEDHGQSDGTDEETAEPTDEETTEPADEEATEPPADDADDPAGETDEPSSDSTARLLGGAGLLLGAGGIVVATVGARRRTS